ncbi:uncharacterized protein LOC118426205 [Branchiostoma floridae]|uniref:Uncharacterized protein LOC118426205 n=1 Tax=Branchiostoma floridae TaxID=7739 RepID=A0A9J7M111_BRAFL|nr:uncharacterized protein LOC118426205 [Branchiostoma floridae]
MAENLSPPGDTEFSALFDADTESPPDDSDSMEIDRRSTGDTVVEHEFDSDATFCSEVEWGEDLEIGPPLRSSTPVHTPTDNMEWNSAFAPIASSRPTDTSPEYPDWDTSADMFASSSFEEPLPGPAEEEALDLRTVIPETQNITQVPAHQIQQPPPNTTARQTEHGYSDDSVLDLRTVIPETQFF